MKTIKKFLLFCLVLMFGVVCFGQKIFASNESDWKVKEIVADIENIELNNKVILKTEVTGDTDQLQYKYVWQKNNWAEWGVLRTYEMQNEVEWMPESAGKYTLIVDVKDEQGKMVSVKKEFTVKMPTWKFDSIIVNEENPCEVATDFVIEADTKGNTEGLLYKYVWQKDNWSEWGVIQDYSEKSTAVFRTDIAADYTLIVDVKGLDGKIVTKQIPCRVFSDVWEFEGIITTPDSPQEKYSGPITIEAKTTGETENLQYKFVWQKDNWKEWGVLKAFSSQSEVVWEPEKEGKYTLYIDVKDKDGYGQTESVSYEIEPVYWNLDEVLITPEVEQKKGEIVHVEAKTSGNTTGLQYKFVWQKDNWKKWGVIRSYSADPVTEWETPKESGNYTIYVDVKDRDDVVRTKSMEYSLVSQIWNLDRININDGIKQQIYRNIPVKAEVSGETTGLQYKYVWQKDNWKEWGVIRKFSEDQEAVWYPKKPGVYEIITDVKDTDGRVKIIKQKYEVAEAPWKLEEIQVEESGSYFVGDAVTVTAVTSGETEGLQYKFVQRNGDDWSDWKVVQEFSSNNTVEVDIEKAGKSTIYVDIRDASGATFDAVTKVIQGHEYLSANSSMTKVTLGRTTRLSPKLSGTPQGMECKYVWMKDNWSSWGVISDYSDKGSIEWKPDSLGKYTIIIDVKLNGTVKSKSVVVDVVKEKYGWYYEGGYKFYYVNGVKQKDIRNLMSSDASYEIKVNKQQNCITVYTKDGGNGYITPVVSFVCSTGNATPVGTFYTPAKYRWLELMGPCWGQWCTQIVSDFLFHSVYYNSYNNNNTLAVGQYNKLGTTCSHGCVRLTAGDAKWIYDNCKLRTKVTIYNSSNPGPLGKPSAPKLSYGHTWDPTDPNMYYKCRARGCH